MSTGIGPASNPYITPDIIPTPGPVVPGVIQTTITTALGPIVSGTTTVNAETYNGAIPGPTLRLNVGETAIVRLVNNLPYPTGIHWHGIELANSADGTEVTQNGAVAAFTPPPAPAPAGGTYLYKFKVTRPGLFWYHPHHHNSTNRVFRGLYGMIIVTDPDETTLVGNTLPAALDTKQLVLSDITVCMTPPNLDTYASLGGAEWLSGATSQPGPTPANLCESPTAVDDDGMGAGMTSWGAGDVPSLMAMSGRINEGQTVLTNGVNVGGRAGTPAAPGAVAAGAYRLGVQRGQGLRLQIVNCATTRYFRLRLTDGAGQQVPLVRVGGEGGLLDNAVLEGITPPVPAGTFDPKHDSGEILLPPSVRADVVVAIPDTLIPGTVLTLWTRDFERLGAGAAGGGPFAKLPTVPVMHLEVSADPAVVPAYTITGGPNGAGGTALRAKVGFPGPLVETLGAANGSLLNPATFLPTPKPGNPAMFVPPAPVSEISDIRLSSGTPGINGIPGTALHGPPPYSNTPHIGSSRYAAAVVGRILELTVTNVTGAHHPFHLHGFSMQPKSLAPRVGAPAGTTGTFTWDYREFRDSINVPANYTLTFRIRLDNRPLVDGVTLGGWLGRWLFHCHIFFHHHRGMVSEFVVTDANGKERPFVDVGGSWAYAGGTPPTRKGTFSSPEGNPVTLVATYGTPGAGALIGTAAPVVTAAPVGTSPGTWSWTYPGGIADGIYYVYITATDTVTLLQGQAVFRLKIGMGDDGADIGDPHIHTVDGKSYDFQQAGEFTLLRDPEAFEIQVRQTPVATATPVVDHNSGLTSCVSINTAVAVRVGGHTISYQPHADTHTRLAFFVDGKQIQVPLKGLDLGGAHVVATSVADGSTRIQVADESGTTITITPWFWTSYNVWLLNVTVANTIADQGLMGRIPNSTWLPALPNGATVGPKPASLHERYVALYRTFADAWRVTNETSLFVYAWGTSTKTFTDVDWPPEQPPCKLKPEFKIPGAHPSLVNIKFATAKRISKPITIKELYRNCVFDVATTGDKTLVKNYLLIQDLRLHGTTVQIGGDKPTTRRGEPLRLTATVMPTNRDGPRPAGSVTFFVDGKKAGRPVKLDKRGRASFTTKSLQIGVHKIRAAFAGGGKQKYKASSSPNLLHAVETKARTKPSGSSDSLAPHRHRRKL